MVATRVEPTLVISARFASVTAVPPGNSLVRLGKRYEPCEGLLEQQALFCVIDMDKGDVPALVGVACEAEATQRAAFVVKALGLSPREDVQAYPASGYLQVQDLARELCVTTGTFSCCATESARRRTFPMTSPQRAPGPRSRSSRTQRSIGRIRRTAGACRRVSWGR